VSVVVGGSVVGVVVVVGVVTGEGGGGTDDATGGGAATSGGGRLVVGPEAGRLWPARVGAGFEELVEREVVVGSLVESREVLDAEPLGDGEELEAPT
jgi:hypothetical protein